MTEDDHLDIPAFPAAATELILGPKPVAAKPATGRTVGERDVNVFLY